MLSYFLLLLTSLWLVAVFKVFILDDGHVSSSSSSSSHLTTPYRPHIIQSTHDHQVISGDLSHMQGEGKVFEFVREAEVVAGGGGGQGSSSSSQQKKSDLQAKHLTLASSNWKPRNVVMKKYQPSPPPPPPPPPPAASLPLQPNQNNIIPSSELSWPPVLSDGSIPPHEGYDVMPLTGLQVPRFWSIPSGQNLFTSGKKTTEGGLETIFLMIASYRDFQCRETITSAFNRADHPERLFIAAVDQVIPGDIGCLDLEIPCEQDPLQAICKYRQQIAVYKMDAQMATGPVTARHVGDRMYRGEYFVMQLDAHCQFVRHWDTKIIDQWKMTHNEMAVLSSYLTDVQGSFTPEGDSARDTRPIMCNSDFEGLMPARYLRHGSQPEDYPIIRDMPQLQPFWAAGFSFSRGHFKIQVPYDGYQPMVFQGEEIAIGIRGFTYGYDFYAPRDSVVFHEYADNSARRKKIHMFWENGGKHAGEGQKSLRRATSVIGMAPDIDPNSWDHSELDRYGLGTVRNLSLFYKIFLIDPVARQAVQLCPFVNSGIMHRDFQPHLRPDHLGIDYSGLENYNTYSKIEAFYVKQHPYFEKILRKGIESRDLRLLKEQIPFAERVQLHKRMPDLVAQAKQVLSELQKEAASGNKPPPGPAIRLNRGNNP